MDSKLVAERLVTASQLKSDGNAAFKEKDYKKAISKYSHIFAYVGGIQTPQDGFSSMLAPGRESNVTQEQLKQLQTLEMDANQNLAASYLQIKNYTRALKFARKALILDSKSNKALIRAGKAAYGLKDLDTAESYFSQAVSLLPESNPQHAVATKLLTTVKQAQAQENAKSDRMLARKMQGMFD